MNFSLIKIFENGGFAMWIIMALSVLAVAVAAERAAAVWQFLRRARTLADTVARCLRRGAVAEARAACERSRSPLADVFLIGFERMGRTPQPALEAAVERERQRVTLDLRTRLWILGTIGATAPFIGLFGTVVGIMSAFKALSERGGGGFTTVSQGISEALITTAGGIAVAVEAVIIYNFFNQRLARIGIELRLFVEEFLEAMRDTGVASTSTSPAPEGKEGTDGARQAS
jgi:biopolymer transport protein ExbB